MKLKNRQALNLELDYLQGNINRMCVSGSIEDIEHNYNYALKRLEAIKNYNIQKNREKEGKEEWK